MLVADHPFPLSGLILVTLMFIVYILLLFVLAYPDGTCLLTDQQGEPLECNQEGVMNSILFWSSDFLMAFFSSLLSLHLFASVGNVIGGTVFAGVSGGYILKGCVTLLFGNSGIDDGKGLQEFYILTAFYYLLWTISVMLLELLVRIAWSMIPETDRPCGITATRVCVCLVIISGIVIAVGCNWSAFSPEVSIEGIVDDYEASDELPTEITVFRVGRLAWHVFSCACVISASFVFGALARQQLDDVMVLGLKVTTAAIGVSMLQIGVLGILMYLTFVAVLDGWDIKYGGVTVQIVLTYIMMLSLFFLHNLFASLFTRERVEYHREHTRLQQEQLELIRQAESDERRSRELHRTRSLSPAAAYDIEQPIRYRRGMRRSSSFDSGVRGRSPQRIRSVSPTRAKSSSSRRIRSASPVRERSLSAGSRSYIHDDDDDDDDSSKYGGRGSGIFNIVSDYIFDDRHLNRGRRGYPSEQSLDDRTWFRRSRKYPRGRNAEIEDSSLESTYVGRSMMPRRSMRR